MRYRLGKMGAGGGGGGLSPTTMRMMESFHLARLRREFGGANTTDDPQASLRLAAEHMRFLAALREKCQQPQAPLPDLLEALPRGEDDRGWLEEFHAALQRSGGDQCRVLLTGCEHDEGQDGGSLSLVAVSFGRRHEVRAGDVVHAGVAAVSVRPAEVQVTPRLYRVQCTNGSMSVLADDATSTCTAADVGATVEACLSGSKVEEEVVRLRVAAMHPVSDPLSLLHRVPLRSPLVEVLRAWEREGDRSGWGLINAITAAARDEASWSVRLQRERDVAGILALLEREAPQRLRALALKQPAPALASARGVVHARERLEMAEAVAT